MADLDSLDALMPLDRVFEIAQNPSGYSRSDVDIALSVLVGHASSSQSRPIRAKHEFSHDVRRAMTAVNRAASTGDERRYLAVIAFDPFSSGEREALDHDLLSNLEHLIKERLLDQRRSGDVITRSDEGFLYLLAAVKAPTHPLRVCERIGEDVFDTFFVGDETFSLDPMFGVRLYEGGTTQNLEATLPDAKRIVRGAGVALTRARYSRKVEVLDGSHRPNRRYGIYRSLSRSAQNDWTGMQLHFQPIVHANASGIELAGAEVLLRYGALVGGKRIFPDEFIPVAEEHPRMMESLGLWVLEQACAYSQRTELGIPYSVNVSAVQLNQQFRARVAGIMERYARSGEHIKLEVTEGVECSGAHRDVIQQLRDDGFGLVVDDVGTGSNTMLSLYEAAGLFTGYKVDKGFVVGLKDIGAERHTRRGAITYGLIHMLSQLGQSVVVEGIETDGNKRFLQTEFPGVLHQGFGFSKPVSGDDFLAYVENPTFTHYGPTS